MWTNAAQAGLGAERPSGWFRLAVAKATVAAVSIKKGDRVSWNTSQGRTQGEARERRVRTFEHAGQTFHASDAEPYWIVQSEKTGASAAHKESSLRKL